MQQTTIAVDLAKSVRIREESINQLSGSRPRRFVSFTCTAGRIQERVKAGLARAKRNGQRLGRPRVELAADAIAAVKGLSVREAARRLGVSRATAHRCLTAAS